MVLGISSVILGWFMIPQIAAIITGHLALRREPSGKGMSITGLVLGYLCLLGYGAFWLILISGAIGIYTNTKNPHAAALFLDFMNLGSSQPALKTDWWRPPLG